MVQQQPDLLPQVSVKPSRAETWARRKITSAMTQSILQGESVPDAARRIRSVVEMDRSASMRAARTSLTGAENAGRIGSYRRASSMAAWKTAGLTASDMSGLVEVQQDNTEAIQDAIADGIMEGLEKIGLVAEGYAKAKCPVDTGRLRNSITHMPKGGISPAVCIGTNVEYGKYVEEGTSKHDAQPFLKPAATEHGSEHKAIMQESLGH